MVFLYFLLIVLVYYLIGAVIVGAVSRITKELPEAKSLPWLIPAWPVIIFAGIGEGFVWVAKKIAGPNAKPEEKEPTNP